MKTFTASLAVVLSASFGGLAAFGANVPAMPLEWNTSYDTSVPYEVELSPAKLQRNSSCGNDCGCADVVV